MKTPITAERLGSIHNPVFRDYAARYVRIYDDFLTQVGATGIEFEAQSDATQRAERLAALQETARVQVRNDRKSVVLNRLSPACVACQTGQGSATFFISLKCHRKCFFCFNPNQADYDYYSTHTRDPLPALDAMRASGQPLAYVALTGGEPLLHKAEAVAFFRRARENFPEVHARLYTCGDFVEPQILAELKAAGLDEIRFSLRMHDTELARRHTLECIALARGVLPSVVVEMPVLPDRLADMRALLIELDRLGVDSINLLEFCFPWRNAPEFAARGYRVRRPPFRVLYDYWYAGGLPIAGSELACLELLEFARTEGLRLGVHYCSLENKHTGQIYQQNGLKPAPAPLSFSRHDYFLRSAKVFGNDVPRTRRALRAAGCADPRLNREHDYLEFPLSAVGALTGLEVEIGLSANVMEQRDGEPCVREVAVDFTTPQTFDSATDA
ncbi:MAG: radical SAM protein [Arenimonas sp.]